MHPHHKTTHTTSSNDLYPVLNYIKEHFYGKNHSQFRRDHRALLRAITWPAAWLDKQALTIKQQDYNRLILRKLRQIKEHGDPRHYRGYFPKYLMKSLQDHCRHHQEAIYLKLKHASYTMAQIASQIEHSTQNQHTQTLAAAHRLLCQNQHKRKTNTDQMTLGL